MKKYIIITVYFALLFGQGLMFAQGAIQLLAGHSRTIQVPVGSKVNIGDPTVATARALDALGQLVITGSNAGVTSLTIYKPGGEVEEKLIRVVTKDPATIVAEINNIFGGVEGVDFEINSGEVIARGAVYTEADLALFQMIHNRYPNIINLVEDKSDKLMIDIEVQFIEITFAEGMDFNNNALPDASGSFFAQSGAAPFWSFGLNVDKILDRIAYWKSKGYSKVIANPTLVVANGDTASFLSGGEVPVPVPVGNGLTGIEYKEFGVRLHILPELTESGKIYLDIMAEVSGVDLAGQEVTSGAPRFLSRRVTSKGLVEDGQTIALAGIYQTTVMKNHRRVPVLGHVLPFIFSAVRENQEVKELIVLVRPRTPVELSIEDYPLLKKELENR
jgi:pilus assembly protein CpaC